MGSPDNSIIYTEELLFNVVLVCFMAGVSYYRIYGSSDLMVILFNSHPIYKGPMNKNGVQLI